MATIEFDSVTKVFRDSGQQILAVEDLDLEIEDGEFVVFVGPSGCGKSTTLRMLAGLETVTRGEISIGGEVVNDLSPKDRDIAMVFQNYALYPHMTAWKNMAYGLMRSTDLSDEEIDDRVREAAEMMGIEDLLDKRPGSLSGGQQQRVATGRAIVRDPAVFLFDEPLSNLDAMLRKHMRTELSRIHSELQTTTIYVTHDQEEAMTMADRIVVLNDGTLQQVGAPKEVYYNPTNAFVANFIGSPSMNMLDVTLDTDGEGGTLRYESVFEYELSADLVETVRAATDRSDLILGIRPENIRVGEDVPEAKAIRAPVDVVEPIGSDTLIYLSFAGTEVRVRTTPDIEPAEGETVTVTFDEGDVHLFDAETQESLTHGRQLAAADERATPTQ